MVYMLSSVRCGAVIAICASLLLIGCAKEEEGPDQAALEQAAQEGVQEAAEKDAIDKTVKPPAALAMFQEELKKSSAQLGTLQVALEAIGENASGNLDPHYETFQNELATMQSLAESLSKRNKDMNDRGTAYFELWEEQLASMKTPAVRELGEKRREELAKDYGAIIADAQLLGDAYDFYMKQLKELNDAFDDDLSEKTVKEVAPKVKKAGEQSKTVKDRIATVVEDLSKIASIYAGT